MRRTAAIAEMVFVAVLPIVTMGMSLRMLRLWFAPRFGEPHGYVLYARNLSIAAIKALSIEDDPEICR